MPVARLRAMMAEGLQPYGVFAGNRMVGFVGVRLLESGDAGMQRLAVLPRFRRQGHGRALVEFAAATACAAGAKRLLIDIVDEHRDLKEWYLGLGFEVLGTRTFPGRPFTLCEMARRLR